MGKYDGQQKAQTATNHRPAFSAGIPLMLLYMTNIGHILGSSFKYLYAKACRSVFLYISPREHGHIDRKTQIDTPS